MPSLCRISFASLTAAAALATPALATASPVSIGHHKLSASETTYSPRDNHDRRQHLVRREIIGGKPGSVNGVVAITANGAGCTGSQVAPRVVLTAAHCMQGVTAYSQIRVRLQYSNQTLGVSRFYYAPGFNSTTHYNDAAVLILNGTARETSLPIASVEPNPGAIALITGYGEHTFGGGAVTTPYYAYTVMQSFAYCQSKFAIPTSVVCAQDYPKNDNTITRGDSGGPLLMASGGRWVIEGITDLVDAPGNRYYGNLPQAFTRVDTLRAWVESLIKYYG